MQVAYPSFMQGESLRRARRRKKLVQLLIQIGGEAPLGDDEESRQAAALKAIPLAAQTDTERTHFIAMVKGRRGLGDALAAKLEARHEKSAGWFDQEEVAWPFSIELQEQIEKLPPSDLHYAEVALWTHLRKDVPEQLHYQNEHQSSQREAPKPSTIVNTGNASQQIVGRLRKQK